MLNHVFILLAFLCSTSKSSSIFANDILVERNHEVVRRSSAGLEPRTHRIIYITPQNADKVIDSMQFPSWIELKKRQRPFTFFVEGIVGTGKSTMLKPFQKYPMMDILPEPVR